MSYVSGRRPGSSTHHTTCGTSVAFNAGGRFNFSCLHSGVTVDPGSLMRHGRGCTVISRISSILVSSTHAPLVVSNPVPHNRRRLFRRFHPGIRMIMGTRGSLYSGVLVRTGGGVTDDSRGRIRRNSVRLCHSFGKCPHGGTLVGFLDRRNMGTRVLGARRCFVSRGVHRVRRTASRLCFIVSRGGGDVRLASGNVSLLANGASSPAFFMLPSVASRLSRLRRVRGRRRGRTGGSRLLTGCSIGDRHMRAVGRLLGTCALFRGSSRCIIVSGGIVVISRRANHVVSKHHCSSNLRRTVRTGRHIGIRTTARAFTAVALRGCFHVCRGLSNVANATRARTNRF